MMNRPFLVLWKVAILVTFLCGYALASASTSAQVPTSSATVQSPASVQASSTEQTSSDSVPSATMFSHVFLSIEGGEIYPFGDLEDAVENTFYGGFGVRYSYWENVDGIVLFAYSYFKPRRREVKLDGVHQFSGKLGLDWRYRRIRPLAIGAGFTCNWTRGDSESENVSFNEDLGGTLVDNETEFGWFVRANLPFWHKAGFHAGLNVMWEQLWTLPTRSNMLSVGVYVERGLW